MKIIKLVIFLFVVMGDVVTMGSPVAKERMPQGDTALIKVSNEYWLFLTYFHKCYIFLKSL